MSFRRCLAFLLPILLAFANADAQTDITEISTGYSTSVFDVVSTALVTLHMTTLIPVVYTTTIVGPDGSTITSRFELLIVLELAADKNRHRNVN